MDNTIHVMIRDRIATSDQSALYVCGNSDFSILFDFDDEWSKVEPKTARFNCAGQPIDIVFTGNQCPVPVISNTTHFYVGVYAGDLYTTTPAYVSARKSILCGGTLPHAPTPDVYTQIMAEMDKIYQDIPVAVEAAKSAVEAEQRVQEQAETTISAVKAQETQSVADVDAAGTAQVETIKQEAAEQVQVVEQKGAEVLGSIPQDYTGLLGEVAQLSETLNTKAPVIAESMKGAICVTDIALDMSLQGLTLYGRTMQNGTPTPEAPVPLVSAGDDGTVEVEVMGKNMANITYSASTTSQYSTVATIKPFKLRAGVSYAVSFDTPNTGITCYINNATFSYKEFVMDGTRKSFVFHITQDRDMTVVGSAGPTFGSSVLISRGTAASDVESGVISNVQIEIGSAATAYEPNKSGGIMTVSTPNGLPGIPVTNGGNYTDQSGQQWICDEIDLERGVYIKRCILADNLYPSAANDKGFKPYYQHVGVGLIGGANHCAICNAIETYRYSSAADSSYFFTEPSGVVRAYLPDNFAEDLKILCAMAEPVETPIPADELAAYRTLHTIQPNTTVCNDAGVGMKVDYAADTKGYIDKKIAAIAAAVL